MALYTKTFLYFITDKTNRSLYVKNGIVLRQGYPPVPLPQNPKGWKDIQISFGTNKKYFSLNRSFTVPMFFVGDGAVICRDAVYSKKGYEEELYIVILKLNQQTGVHELEYKGRLDFGKNIDEPRKGITINSIEGGVLQFINTNDSVQYEIPLDINNPDCIQILFDGVNLYDRYRYSVTDLSLDKPNDFGHQSVGGTLSMPFISNEGDSVGVTQGSQQYEEIFAHSSTAVVSDFNTYLQTSPNYFLSFSSPTIVTLKGTIKLLCTPSGGANTTVGCWFMTSLLQRFQVVNGNYTVTTNDSFSFSVAITLAANEKLFLVDSITSFSIHTTNTTFYVTDIYAEFVTINPPSLSYAIQPLYLWRQLIKKATGGLYAGDSAFFAAHSNVVWTSSNALRNFSYNYYYGPFDTIDAGAGVYQIKIPGTLSNFPDGSELIISQAASNNGGYTVVGTSLATIGFTVITVLEPLTNASLVAQISTAAVIKISIQDFFNDEDCDNLMGLQIRGGVAWIEPIEDIYKPDAEIFDIGEITDLKFSYAYDMLCNTATFGSKSQDYRQRNGRYEFNTTTLFNLPVTTLKKDYTKITKSRRDCFGIEFQRALIFDKPSTDATGDNQAFMIDVVKGVTYKYYVGSFEAQINTGLYYIVIPRVIFALVAGTQFIISGAASNNGTYTVVNVSYIVAGVTLIQVLEPVTNAMLNGILTTTDPNLYGVNRPAYSSITGVLDNTVFNTEITPHHQLLKHGRMMASILCGQPADKIVFRTTDKNGDLVTTLAGVTVAEKQTEIIGNLGTALFYPFYGEFKTRVPLSFNAVYSNLGTGYIKGTYIGVPVYFLPIGQMDAKPALNEPQVWKMILAGPEKNSLETIKLLSLDGGFTTDIMGNFIFTSTLQPLQFVKYNYTLPAKYQYKFMHDDIQPNRNENYIGNPFYLQKFQTTESIPVQCLTRGIATPNVEVYDADGNLYFTAPMAVTVDAAVIAPMVRWDYLIDISAYPENYYQIVITDGTNKLRISEWIHIAALHEGTQLFEYSHSTNKYAFYFGGIEKPNIRVESTLLTEYPDSTFTEYTDEISDYEMIDGIPVMKRLLTLNFIPDWLSEKMNMILLLNGTFIEGKHYSRTPDSKFNKKQIAGYPFYKYDIEICLAHNTYGLATDESGTEEEFVVLTTLDAQGFGQANPGDVITIDLNLVP
jgi:hypothetical protein